MATTIEVNGNESNQEWSLNDPLEKADPEIYEIIKKEKDRQIRGLEMIASENFTSLAVLQCMSSCLHNKYSEGQPGHRYYGGNEFIDEMELLTQKRALEAFHLDPEKWGVNVQPYSGSSANFEVYAAIVGVHGRIMGLDLPDGGHLTHGFYTSKKRISATSIFFESLPYKVNPETGLIDYEALERTAGLFKPQMIIAGFSCYSRNLDYAQFRRIADVNNSYLMADMAHIAGLVAAGVVPSPFDYCDIVTSTVHKTLRGPRAGIIFYRKGVRSVDKKGVEIIYDFEDKINAMVFPGLQGGPHNQAIVAVAVALKHATSSEFVAYQKQVVRNAKAICDGLIKLGYKIATGGTDNHMILVDLSPQKLSGAKAEKILEEILISCNKNTVPGDKSAMNPSGIRLGTPPLTTRGMVESDMLLIVDYIDQAFKIAKEIQDISGLKLTDWIKELASNSEVRSKLEKLRSEVDQFARKFRMPGYPEY